MNFTLRLLYFQRNAKTVAAVPKTCNRRVPIVMAILTELWNVCTATVCVTEAAGFCNLSSAYTGPRTCIVRLKIHN